ncbi:MAG TPA: hypothetical protein VG454_09015 [Gemmatimonadales bacterium]|nr:hypothetical protein [Gemmatimonadales bacterium]
MRTTATLVAAGALAVMPACRLAAQHFSVGPQIAFGDYRETTSDLHFRGAGLGAKASVLWKKFSADVWLSKINYKPHGDSALADFDASEVNVQLRYFISGPFSAELGFMNRKADPEFEAQSMGALTAGAQMSHLLGPGVRMALDGGVLFGPKFSGGGSISPLGAVRLGLGLTVDALKGRLHVVGDYEFQSVSRKTDDGSGSPALPAPIQQSLGRIGLAIAF